MEAPPRSDTGLLQGQLPLSSAIEAYRSDRHGYGFVVSIAAVVLVFTVDQVHFLQGLFTNRYSLYMGRISIPLYLVHGPLLWTSMGAFPDPETRPARWTGNGGAVSTERCLCGRFVVAGGDCRG